MTDMSNDVRLELTRTILQRRAASRGQLARACLAVQVYDRAKNPPRGTFMGLPVPARWRRLPSVRRRAGHTATALLLSVLAACSSSDATREADSVADTPEPTTTPAEVVTTTPAEATATDPAADLEHEEPTLLSAFFGLDDALPPISAALCDGAPGMDGLVVVVNDRLTTAAGDQFEVVTRSGARLTPMCATLAPADEPEERRTVLLIGDLGNAATDPPVEVITPRSLDTDIAVDGARYAGRSIAVTPLGDGPTLVAAEWAEPTADCPAGTIATLRVAWAGGIVLTDGTEIAPDDTALYNLTIDDPSQSPVELTGLGDLGDNDNYHELCTTSTPRPVVITVAAGTFQDPNGDTNPIVELAAG